MRVAHQFGIADKSTQKRLVPQIGIQRLVEKKITKGAVEISASAKHKILVLQLQPEFILSKSTCHVNIGAVKQLKKLNG